ncbi:hypothetical protein GDO86_012520 [Hymenochirus boettgeri]|uniref:Uncharacterized protein n=1 Tax=Hymenochirus boettgeri TaxID=247094 RepID=A0A8T2IQY1_9PIPI|nr:hypothetical protein GDO86_012520 [Hymenochirus boettgeri]
MQSCYTFTALCKALYNHRAPCTPTQIHALKEKYRALSSFSESDIYPFRPVHASEGTERGSRDSQTGNRTTVLHCGDISSYHYQYPPCLTVQEKGQREPARRLRQNPQRAHVLNLKLPWKNVCPRKERKAAMNLFKLIKIV